MQHRSTQAARLQYGPYRIVAKVGSGGMARVYKARHQETGEIVALKVAAELALLDATLRKRFLREFEVARRLCHPHLVRALDCGEVDDALYQVLEFVDGQNLEQRIRDKGPLTLAEALDAFLQIADALAYMHQQGVLHRDIKPNNIMLQNDGAAKLADFGLLKNLASQSSLLTRSNQSMGTIGFGAPEQFEDAKRADARCDVYSLAASFYVAVAGVFPFGSGGNIKILRRKLNNQFVPLAQIAPAIAPALDQMVTCCLSADPAGRPESCAAFSAALQEQQQTLTGSPPSAPAPVRSGPSDAIDKRQAIRSPVQLAASCEPMFGNSRRCWTAAVANLSKTGLCLQATWPFEAGTVLQINFDLSGHAEPPSLLARIRWIYPATQGRFTMGCEFVQPLSPNQFDLLHHAGTQKTVIIEAADD